MKNKRFEMKKIITGYGSAAGKKQIIIKMLFVTLGAVVVSSLTKE